MDHFRGALDADTCGDALLPHCRIVVNANGLQLQRQHQQCMASTTTGKKIILAATDAFHSLPLLPFSILLLLFCWLAIHCYHSEAVFFRESRYE